MQKNFYEVYFFIRKHCRICGVLSVKDNILILVLEEERSVSLFSLYASGLAGSTMPTETDLQRWPFHLATSFHITQPFNAFFLILELHNVWAYLPNFPLLCWIILV
jgi:hypothetical protein